MAEGRAELDAWLSHRIIECPGEVYVLAGLSQGAEVVGEGLLDLSEAVLDRIAYVALFGDPTYTTLTDRNGPLSDRCENDWLPSWVEGTAQCWAQGILGERVPYIPASLEGRVGSWCSLGDFACTAIASDIVNFNNPDGGPHGRYMIDGHAAKAMQKAAESLEDFLPEQADDIDASFLVFATGGAGADLVFIFDTTGSMGSSIANAKAQATDLANLWLNTSTNGRIALVEFRDQGDAFVARIVSPLTNDAEDFQTAVNQLVAGGGGDTPEAQLSGVMTALDGLDWQVGATKVGIVITDALGKDPEPVTGYTRAQAAQRALEIDPVAIYGVNVSTLQSVTDWMAPLAEATAGEVAVLGQGQTLSDLLGDVINVVALSPVGVLGGPYFAASGNPVFFDADRSFDPDAELVSYKWDFDGNGTTDQTTTDPKVAHTYPGAFSGLAVVRVVSADGGEAIASAEVTVDTAGLADDLAVAPTAASASVTGPGQVTVTWTPAANDRADSYMVKLSDAPLLRSSLVGGGNSVTFTGIDLSQPQTFGVRAANEYGVSPATSTTPVGGETIQFATRTFSFASGLDGWTGSGSNCTSQHSSTDGTPAGSLSTAVVGKNKTVACRWLSPLATWQSWGVPAGAVVTNARLQSAATRLALCSSCLSGQINGYRLETGPGQTVATLWTGRALPNSQEAWQTAAPQPDQEIGPSWRGSNSNVRLALDATLKTGNPGSASVTLRQDQIVVVVTYQSGGAPPPDYSVSLNAQGPVCPQGQSCTNDVPTVTLTGSGTAATSASGAVTVEWRLYGVSSAGITSLMSNFVAATPADGMFDEPQDAFTISNVRPDQGFVSYEVEIRATTQGISTTRTNSVPISRCDPAGC